MCGRPYSGRRRGRRRRTRPRPRRATATTVRQRAAAAGTSVRRDAGWRSRRAYVRTWSCSCQIDRAGRPSRPRTCPGGRRSSADHRGPVMENACRTRGDRHCAIVSRRGGAARPGRCEREPRWANERRRGPPIAPVRCVRQGAVSEITVQGGHVTRIRGDRDDVFSHGFICPKGSTLKQLHEDPDRLRTPLVRRDGELVEATWDEAFAEIERRLAPIIEHHGRDAVAVYLGNPNAHIARRHALRQAAGQGARIAQRLLGEHRRPAAQGARRRR